MLSSNAKRHVFSRSTYFTKSMLFQALPKPLTGFFMASLPSCPYLCSMYLFRNGVGEVGEGGGGMGMGGATKNKGSVKTYVELFLPFRSFLPFSFLI